MTTAAVAVETQPSTFDGLSVEQTRRWDRWQEANTRSARRSTTQVRILFAIIVAAVVVRLVFALLQSPAVV